MKYMVIAAVLLLTGCEAEVRVSSPAPTPSAKEQLLRQISSYTAKLIRQEPDKSVYLMNIQGKAVRIVYNTKERRFITALSPEDAW